MKEYENELKEMALKEKEVKLYCKQILVIF